MTERCGRYHLTFEEEGLRDGNDVTWEPLHGEPLVVILNL